MSFESFFSPLTMTMLTLVSIGLIPLVLVDNKVHRAKQKTIRSLYRFAATRATMKPTIVVDVTKPEKLEECIIHLKQFSSSRLRLIAVVPSHYLAAARRAQRAYRPELDIAIMTKKPNTDQSAAIRRRAKGQLIYEMTTETRLTQQFIDELSLYFIDDSVDAVVVHPIVALDNRLLTAALAWTSVVQTSAVQLGLLAPRLSVHRKTSWRKAKPVSVAPSTLTVYGAADSRLARRGLAASIALITAMSAAIILTPAYFPTVWWYVPLTLYVVFIGVMSLQLSSTPYRASEKLLLLLVLPFWPLISLLAFMATEQKSLSRRRSYATKATNSF